MNVDGSDVGWGQPAKSVETEPSESSELATLTARYVPKVEDRLHKL